MCSVYLLAGPSFAVKQNRLFGSGNGFILLDDLNCDGTESNLLECRSTTEHGINNCRPSEDAAIFCSSMSVERLMHACICVCIYAYIEEVPVVVCTIL